MNGYEMKTYNSMVKIIRNAETEANNGNYEVDTNNETYIPVSIPYDCNSIFRDAISGSKSIFIKYNQELMDPLSYNTNARLYFKIKHTVHLKSLTEDNLRQLMKSPKWDEYEAGPITFITTPTTTRFFVSLTKK